jgi:hypothetical protein
MDTVEVIEAPKNKGGRPKGSGKPKEDTGLHAVEISYWDSVKNTRDPGDIESYLDRWPDGHFAVLAERRIKQLLQAAVQGGNPDDYVAPKKRAAIIVPTTPIPVIDHSKPLPKYLLLAPFFAENDTFYAADQEIEYLGPPNEHMYPLNEAGFEAKREQEEYLDACWAVKCKAEGRPAIPRPKELADQIEAERNMLRADRGVVTAPEPAPTRPDLAKNPIRNPNAARVGAVTPGKRYADRPSLTQAPVLGRDGGRYQREVKQGFGMPDPAA